MQFMSLYSLIMLPFLRIPLLHRRQEEPCLVNFLIMITIVGAYYHPPSLLKSVQSFLPQLAQDFHIKQPKRGYKQAVKCKEAEFSPYQRKSTAHCFCTFIELIHSKHVYRGAPYVLCIWKSCVSHNFGSLYIKKEGGKGRCSVQRTRSHFHLPTRSV